MKQMDSEAYKLFINYKYESDTVQQKKIQELCGKKSPWLFWPP